MPNFNQKNSNKFMIFIISVLSVFIYGCGGGGSSKTMGAEPPPPPPPPIRFWASPQKIETFFLSSPSFPNIAIDSNNTINLIWGYGDIYTSSYSEKSAWSTPSSLYHDSNNLFYPDIPSIAMDQHGNAFALWANNDRYGNMNSYAYSSKFTPNQGWSTETPIGLPGGRINDTQIEASSNGTVIATWCQSNGAYDGDWQIFVNQYTQESGWNTPTLIDNSPGSAGDVHLAVDNTGNVTIVWSKVAIYACSYDATSKTWGNPTLIGTNGSSPKVVMDKEGKAIAIWNQDDGPDTNLYSSTYSPLTGWTSASLIENSPGDVGEPSIAININGNAIAVWNQKETEGYKSHIFSNIYSPESGWGAPKLIEKMTESASSPHVVIDSSGNATAAWYQEYGNSAGIFVSDFLPNQGWGEPRIVAAGNLWGPDLKMNSNGMAVLVWIQRNNDNKQEIFASIGKRAQ